MKSTRSAALALGLTINILSNDAFTNINLIHSRINSRPSCGKKQSYPTGTPGTDLNSRVQLQAGRNSTILDMDTKRFNVAVTMKDKIPPTEELLKDAAQQLKELESVEAVLAASKELDTVGAVLAASKNAAAAVEARMLVTSEFTSPIIADVPRKVVPASAVVCKPVAAEKIEAPSISKILKFAVPAMGVWLCSPLLSMIDTSAVGILSGTIQQAALNPAVAVTDYMALCIAFLYAATTNMVAAARESERGVVDKPETSKTFLGAMQLSTYVGAGLGLVLFVFAKPFLKAIIGNDAIDPAVFSAAMNYVRIRSLGMPGAAIIGSAQAACLGMQDIKSPLYVLLAAAVVNFVCDMVFVGNPNPLIGGASGAAWATVFSQYAAVALFMRWLCRKQKLMKPEKPAVVNLTKAIEELTGKPSSEGAERRQSFRQTVLSYVRRPDHKNVDASENRNDSQEEESSSVRGLLDNKASLKDIVKLPPMTIAKKFVPYIVPVTATQVGRVSAFAAMSHVVASSFGTVSMAAQQILVSLCFCLCPVPDSLNLTAQSFVPAIFEKKPSRERARALGETQQNFMKAGTALSALTVGLVGLIPLLSKFFTTDPAVVSMVNMGAPYLAMFFSVHGFMCASEGLLLGQKDLGFLGKMYGLAFFAVPYFMFRVKHAAISGAYAVGLNSVWQVFVGYQLVRASLWSWRASSLRRKANRDYRDSRDSPVLLDTSFAAATI